MQEHLCFCPDICSWLPQQILYSHSAPQVIHIQVSNNLWWFGLSHKRQLVAVACGCVAVYTASSVHRLLCRPVSTHGSTPMCTAWVLCTPVLCTLPCTQLCNTSCTIAWLHVITKLLLLTEGIDFISFCMSMHAIKSQLAGMWLVE